MSQQSLWITSTVSKVMNISLPIFAGDYLEDVTQPFFPLLRKANSSSCRTDAHLVSDGFGDSGDRENEDKWLLAGTLTWFQLIL